MVDRINNNNNIQQTQPNSSPTHTKKTSSVSFLGKAASILFSGKSEKVQIKSGTALQNLNDVRDGRTAIQKKASAIVELIEKKAISSQDTFKELINLKKDIKRLNQSYLKAHAKFNKSLIKINRLAIGALRFQGKFQEAKHLEERFSKSKSQIKEEAKEASEKFEAGLTKNLIDHTAIMEKHIKSLFN